MRAGGATNHRSGLDDGILIKDNHIRLGGGVAEVLRKMKAAHLEMPIEIEAQQPLTLRLTTRAFGVRVERRLPLRPPGRRRLACVVPHRRQPDEERTPASLASARGVKRAAAVLHERPRQEQLPQRGRRPGQR